MSSESTGHDLYLLQGCRLPDKTMPIIFLDGKILIKWFIMLAAK